MRFIEYLSRTVIEKIESTVFLRVNSVTGQSLVLTRVTIGFIALTTLRFNWHSLAEVPSSLFNPSPYLFLANIIGFFPKKEIIYFIELSFVLALVMFSIGKRYKVSCLYIGIVWLVMTSLTNSFGKIDHGVLIGVFFLLASQLRMYILEKSSNLNKINNAFLVSIALVTSIGMLTAGLPKLIGWVDFDISTNGFLSWYTRRVYSMSESGILSPYILRLNPAILEMVDYLVVIFEISGVFLILSGWRKWRFWVVFAILFHLLTLLILGINFISHLPVYLLFILPEAFDGKISTKLDQRKVLMWSYILTSVAIIVFIINQLISLKYFRDINYYYSIVLWFLSLIIGIILITRRMRYLYYEKS